MKRVVIIVSTAAVCMLVFATVVAAAFAVALTI